MVEQHRSLTYTTQTWWLDFWKLLVIRVVLVRTFTPDNRNTAVASAVSDKHLSQINSQQMEWRKGRRDNVISLTVWRSAITRASERVISHVRQGQRGDGSSNTGAYWSIWSTHTLANVKLRVGCSNAANTVWCCVPVFKPYKRRDYWYKLLFHYFLLPHANTVYVDGIRPVGPPLFFKTEITQQLSDTFLWNFVKTFHVPQGRNRRLTLILLP